jgi:phosphate transport system protein
MESPFVHELDALKTFLLTMAGEVEHQLELTVRSLVERDATLAEQVIAGDALIDRREIEADRHIVEAIVRGRPLARDLRFVMTAGKIAPDLERIGDHAVNIARRSLQL